MKKEFLKMLKITFQRHYNIDVVRLYSKEGYIWAQRIGQDLNLYLRLVPTDQTMVLTPIREG